MAKLWNKLEMFGLKTFILSEINVTNNLQKKQFQNLQY